MATFWASTATCLARCVDKLGSCRDRRWNRAVVQAFERATAAKRWRRFCSATAAARGLRGCFAWACLDCLGLRRAPSACRGRWRLWQLGAIDGFLDGAQRHCRHDPQNRAGALAPWWQLSRARVALGLDLCRAQIAQAQLPFLNILNPGALDVDIPPTV